MKILLSIMAIASVVLTSAAYAGEYADLAAQGFRWVLVDGPYACTTEQYLEQITARRSDAAELRVIEEGQCYYLVPGTIVQVLKEDPRRHMSLMQMGSVARSLWTYTRFLSQQPVRDTYGIVEMPEDVGLIWPSNPGTTTRTVPANGSTVGIQ
jgi:hypothetical protein